MTVRDGTEQPEHTQTYGSTGERPTGAGAVVLVLCSADDIRVASLEAATTLTVGRAPSCDVRLDAPSLSRVHASFTRSEGGIVVEDLDSHNGVSLHGRAVRRGQLRIGDVLRLGEVVVLVCDQEGRAAHRSVLSHAGILASLEREVSRARQARTSLPVLMIQAASQGARTHVGHWCAQVRRQLRPIDSVGIYDPSRALAVLPGTSLEEARLAAARLGLGARGEFHVGVACFPSHAVSAGELLARAAEVAQQAVQDGTEIHVANDDDGPPQQGDAIVHNPAMQELYALVQRVARTDAPVLVLGETGSGKELVAHAVHEHSRRSGALRVVNCAALPETLLESLLFGHERGAFTGAHQSSEGLFEQAVGGTLFLDEIGELSPAAQATLLRVLDTKRVTRLGSSRERAVDARVVAATHQPLDEMVRHGSFREDLYHRLNTFTVRVPPLRERLDEIIPLARHFLASATKRWKLAAHGFDDAVQGVLLAHDWPGNVRELRNVVERAAVICDETSIRVQDLPEAVRRAPVEDAHPAARDLQLESKPLKAHLRELEEALIRRALADCHGNQVKAAERLQMPRRTLVQRLSEYGIRG